MVPSSAAKGITVTCCCCLYAQYCSKTPHFPRSQQLLHAKRRSCARGQSFFFSLPKKSPTHTRKNGFLCVHLQWQECYTKSSSKRVIRTPGIAGSSAKVNGHSFIILVTEEGADSFLFLSFVAHFFAADDFVIKFVRKKSCNYLGSLVGGFSCKA